ncbi:unnamed protein product, partial [Symbiodinium necroappetens]
MASLSTVPALEDAIAVGSFLLQGGWLRFSAGAVLLGGLLTMVLVCTLWTKLVRLERHVQALPAAFQDLQKAVGNLANNVQTLPDQTAMQSLLDAVGDLAANVQPLLDQMPRLPVAHGTQASDATRNDLSSDMANTMLCLDAKILELNNETQRLRKSIGDLNHQMGLQQPGSSEEAIQPLKDLLLTLVDKHKKIAEALPVVHTIPALTRTCQTLGLDTQKQFSMQETMSDGLLKQGRETLQCLQSDNKSTHDRIIKLDALTQELKEMLKQLGIDIHVTRTKMETKLDSTQADLKRFQGETNYSFRGLNVLVPNHKTLVDTQKDALDYLVRANQSESSRHDLVQHTLDTVSNVEDRLVRLESICMGSTDVINETSDQVQQLREAHNLMMEQVTTIVERTPKLPKRNPPQADAASSTTPPPQQSTPPMPSMPTAPMPSVPIIDPQPIRLSDHIQPLVRDQGGIYMLGGNSTLRNVSTQELLQDLQLHVQFT